ncbi:protein of unknown function [Halomicrobium zhouii]|uniref:DUF4112 domain-containing protein n=1 Tax=Halomicrobium zhouii TaxID=767519 RepID=A0A1I6M276_9EURY|nr:DUF4112 domain-containing protein [Halomicrobium zhouii]SFS09728.1 protein of unknown function [Halomicrobium zhouii]
MAQTSQPATDIVETAAAEPAPLARARVVGTLLDESLTVPGTGFKVGLDPLLGILPVAGDSVAAVASLYIVFVGLRLGLPKRALVKMVAYVALDFTVGSVPVLGTVVDAFLKVNVRNVGTIERHVDSDY